LNRWHHLACRQSRHAPVGSTSVRTSEAIAAGARLQSTSDTPLDVYLRSSLPVTGGWQVQGLRVPPTRKGLSPRALEQQITCID
jgi:hypothetical protein